jgi:hypothetical protein
MARGLPLLPSPLKSMGYKANGKWHGTRGVPPLIPTRPNCRMGWGHPTSPRPSLNSSSSYEKVEGENEEGGDVLTPPPFRA